MWKIKSRVTCMIDFVILHSEPEVIGTCICNINLDTDESFEMSIEFQCHIFKRVSVFL